MNTQNNRLYCLFTELKKRGKPLTVGTHDGVYHLDESMCLAMLWKLTRTFGIEMAITRTRDQELLEKCDILVDVGMVYDRKTMRFDHHQRGGAGSRTKSGISYSSIGLFWKEFGEEFVIAFVKKHIREDKWGDILPHAWLIAKRIDNVLITGICAVDNGQAVQNNTPNIQSLSAAFVSTNPIWISDDSYGDQDEVLESMLPFLARILCGYVQREAEAIYSIPKIELIIQRTGKDFPLLILPNPSQGWRRITIQKPNILFVVQPEHNNNGTWCTNAIGSNDGNGHRVTFPKEWRGLTGEELANASDIPGIRFCHTGGFFVSADNEEAAVSAALHAIEIDQEEK